MISLLCHDTTSTPDDLDQLPPLMPPGWSQWYSFHDFDYTTLNPITYGVLDPNKIEFSSNVYLENFGSNGQGLIEIQGVLRVYFYNESYSTNGENNYQTQTYLQNNTAYGISLFLDDYNDGITDLQAYENDQTTVSNAYDFNY